MHKYLQITPNLLIINIVRILCGLYTLYELFIVGDDDSNNNSNNSTSYVSNAV